MGQSGRLKLIGTSDCAFDIRIGSPDGDLFTTGGQVSFTAQTGAWVKDGMKFYVQAHNDTTSRGTLSMVVSHVIHSQASSTCTASVFAVKDSPVRAVGPTGTTVLSGNVNCAYDIRVDSAKGALFTSGLSGGAISAQTGNWVTDGMTFYLQPAGSTDPTATLGISTATLQTAAPSCTIGGFTATPITTGSAGNTTLTGTVGCDYEIHVDSPIRQAPTVRQS